MEYLPFYSGADSFVISVSDGVGAGITVNLDVRALMKPLFFPRFPLVVDGGLLAFLSSRCRRVERGRFKRDCSIMVDVDDSALAVYFRDAIFTFRTPLFQTRASFGCHGYRFHRFVRNRKPDRDRRGTLPSGINGTDFRFK